MKIILSHRRSPAPGYALVIVLFFATISMVYLGVALDWSSTNSVNTERSNQLNGDLFAAEAACEKVASAMFYDFKLYGQGQVSLNLATYRSSVPNSGESSYWSDYSFSDGAGNVGKTYVQSTGSQYFTNPLTGAYSGLSGTRVPYRIISNARRSTSRYAITNAVQEDVAFTTIPVFQFAIFYNGLLEFTRCAPLLIHGHIHSNSNIYYGTLSGSYQTNYDGVTSSGIITNKSPWFGSSNYTGPVAFLGGKTEHAATLALPIGTNNTSAAVHQVIEMPPSGEDQGSAMGTNRYYNKAELLILVSNTTVTVAVKTPFATTSNNITWTNNANSFIYTNATFYDQREQKTNQVTDIDIGRMNSWAATNTTVRSALGSGNIPNLLYVVDNRTKSGYNQAIRITNGAALSSRGLTVSSPNPLYVKGTFNCSNNSYLGTTNTTYTAPASFVADAVTILSAKWSDSASKTDYASRSSSLTPTNITVNAAIISGNVPSSSDGTSTMSGGAHNLPRFLEAWSGVTVTINGSLVCLYQSTKATNKFVTPGDTGDYYSAPNRLWSLDNNFQDPSKLPPGTPAIKVLERVKWARPPANTTNYAGY